jgi:hypothetical protein
MPGLVLNDFHDASCAGLTRASIAKDVDGRVKPGHDEEKFWPSSS